jgi:hypothetical protein
MLFNIGGCPPPGRVYGGVEIDVKCALTEPREIFASSDSSFDRALMLCTLPLWIADIPLSVVGDTLTLPITLPFTLVRGEPNYEKASLAEMPTCAGQP